MSTQRFPLPRWPHTLPCHRNPCTGATVKVKPKRLAFFKVGKELE